MFTMYGLLKTVHVLSVVVWVGGVAALWTVTVRLGRAGNRSAIATLLPLAMRFGQRVAGPAALLVLASGISMIIVGHLGGPLWVQIGFLGIALQIVLGASIIRINWRELGRLAAASTPDQAAFDAILRRTSLTNWLYLLLMVIIIAAMVLKPAL
jgi:uncharacterized membrane protein